jgi:hypothetical protein
MLMLASARGGQCLSPQYIHSKVKLTWRCARGHLWRALPPLAGHSSAQRRDVLIRGI